MRTGANLLAFRCTFSNLPSLCRSKDDALGNDAIVDEVPERNQELTGQATIILLREPGTLSVRARNQHARALSFWNIRKRQASWINPRRTRILPDRANPFSRRLLPLSSGEPVSPA